MRDDHAILARRLDCQVAWIRVLWAARKVRAALKHNPNWASQPRVPAGHPDGGQWTDGGGSDIPAPAVARESDPWLRWDDVLGGPAAGGEDDLPVVLTGGRGQGRSRLQARYPSASLGQITRLEIAISQARFQAGRLRKLDPDWRPQPSWTATIEGEIAHFEAMAGRAQERFHKLTLGAIPGFNPLWGRNRLTKELYEHGYRLLEQARGKGLVYRNERTGERVRIMERPARRKNTDADAKHLFRYYYRYQSGKDQPWNAHTPIPGTD